MNPDPLRYYDLEDYLLNEVQDRFKSQGWIGAFDFFSIVIWKANRAKSLIAKRLHKKYPEQGLEQIARNPTRSLHDADDDENRLRILADWGFMLPMATAILTILWPDEFTVYDVRVCDELDDFRNLDNLGTFEKKWARYGEYRDAVRAAVSQDISLRNKDRYLWAQYGIRRLTTDIAAGFPTPQEKQAS